MAEKPQMFFWSSDGFVFKRDYSVLSEFYRREGLGDKKGNKVSMEEDFKHANVHQDYRNQN